MSRQSARFRSFNNRLLIAGWTVLFVGVAWTGLNAVLVGVAQPVGRSTRNVLVASTGLGTAKALVGVALACRVRMHHDDVAGTVTAVNLLKRREFSVRDVVAVRIVLFPSVRQRHVGVGMCPMIEVKTAAGDTVRLLATAISTKRDRQGALDFLRAAGLRAVPSRREYVDDYDVAQQWSPAQQRPRTKR